MKSSRARDFLQTAAEELKERNVETKRSPPLQFGFSDFGDPPCLQTCTLTTQATENNSWHLDHLSVLSPRMSISNDVSTWLDNKFLLTKRETSIGQEFRAATATFLTMSYILLVNPQLLSKIGIPPTAVVVSTALASFAGSFVAGYFGYGINSKFLHLH